MSLLQPTKAIFYHPLDTATETIKSEAWTGTSSFAAAKVSLGLFPSPGDSVSSFGSKIDFFSGEVTLVRVVPLSSTKVVVVYNRVPAPKAGKARVGTVSGTDITFGTEIEFLSSELSHLSIAAISATQVVVEFGNAGNSNGTARVGTVSGTDITFGTAVIFNATTPTGDVENIDSTRVVVAFADGTTNGSARVGTVSGTDVTFGTATVFRSGNTGIPTIAPLSSTAVAIVYRELAVNGDGLARVGTVSGTDITFGAESAMALAISGAGEDSDAVALSATKFVVAYARGSLGKAKVGTVSGTGITFGAEAEFNGTSITGDLEVEKISSSQFIISYQDDSELGQTKVGTVSGADVTFGAATEHQGATSKARFNSVALLDASTFVVCYRNEAPNAGRATIGTLAGATASLTGTSATYDTVVGATKVAWAGWYKKPSA